MTKARTQEPPWDLDALASLELKLQPIREWTTSIAKKIHFGLYLWGTGGIGKTHTVLERLDFLKADYRLYNSRITAKGLFNALDDSPDAVHVIEDCEQLTKDQNAQGVLRSALWATEGRERIVTWVTDSEGDRRFVFTGGIIFTSNLPLAKLPALKALASRIKLYKLDATDAEISAKVCELASQGYRTEGKTIIEAKECLLVAKHVLDQCRACRCPVNLRMLEDGYKDFYFHRSQESGMHWTDLVSTSIREAATNLKHEIDTRSAEDKRRAQRCLIRKLMAETKDVAEQERRFREETGTSHGTFFNRKGEVTSGEFDTETEGA